MQKKIHRAKKSLGQNFLKSETALRKIVEAGEINSSDIILEIGPGKGALTEKLLEKSSCVIAVEKDKNLIELLKEKFSEEIKSGKLILFNEDILDFGLSSIRNTFFQVLGRSHSLTQTIQKSIPDSAEQLATPLITLPVSYKIIANIPYNITGAILKKFLTTDVQPSMMVLMVQHEVAKRIIARDKKESILSISVKAYGTPKLVMKVPARYFSPAPKVDSAIISIKNISRKNFMTPSPFGHSPLAGGEEFEKRFWEIIHAGFAHKRKKLSSNLKKYIGPSHGVKLGNKRAEDFSLEDWLLLTKEQ